MISDHKRLLRLNRGQKTFSSGLPQWFDRLLPFDFEITHAPGRVLGFTDYLIRHPSELEGSTIHAKQLWNFWFTVNAVSKINAIPVNEAKPVAAQKSNVLTRTRGSALEVESENESERQSSEDKTKPISQSK